MPSTIDPAVAEAYAAAASVASAARRDKTVGGLDMRFPLLLQQGKSQSLIRLLQIRCRVRGRYRLQHRTDAAADSRNRTHRRAIAAAITAWVRLSTPSFCRIAETCALMVASDTPSS